MADVMIQSSTSMVRLGWLGGSMAQGRIFPHSRSTNSCSARSVRRCFNLGSDEVGSRFNRLVSLAVSLVAG